MQELTERQRNLFPAETIEGEPDQQHEDDLDVSNDTTVTTTETGSVRDVVQDYNCDACDQVFNSKKRLRNEQFVAVESE